MVLVLVYPLQCLNRVNLEVKKIYRDSLTFGSVGSGLHKIIL